MPRHIKLDLITTGNELLLGIRTNTHLSLIGSELGRHGLFVRRNLTCGDSAEEVRWNLEQSIRGGAEAIILTGGLGPTVDDSVKETVSEYLGLSLHFDETIKKAIEARFERLNLVVNQNNLKQCYVPEGAEVLDNPYGTAPGLFLKQNGLRIFLLPGPTSELEPMLVDSVIPRLCADGYCNYNDAYLQLRFCGIGESALETRLKPVLGDISGLEVAFCAHQGIVDLRLNAREGSNLSEEAVREIAERCRVEIGEDFFTYGHDSLQRVVFDILRASESTLAVAESCTGGMLSNAFTDIPGASKVFKGGFVCYNNDAKVQMLGIPECIVNQHGAVSAECAVAMADAAAETLSTEYALSITGFAGPSGGTPENPVGTIYIGYHSPIGTWCVKMVKPGRRAQVKERAVNRALDVMRRKLHRYRVEEAFAAMATC